MHDAVGAFWVSRPPLLGNEKEMRWRKLDEATEALHQLAKATLLPTIRQERGTP